MKTPWMRTALAAVLCSAALGVQAQISDGKVRVMVLTDLSSVYSDTSGKGSVVAAELAAEDAGGKVNGVPVEIVRSDHQNKPDIGVTSARRGFDVEGVDALVDISNSAVSLAVQNLAKDKGKVVLHVGSAHADLYGKACSPTGALWLYDTYALAKGIALANTSGPSDSWFFITANYAFGTAMENEVRKVVEGAGAKVLGSVKHPVGNPDFSSFVVQAQQSGAKIVGLANASSDTVNAIKQAGEFGLTQRGQRLAALIFYIQSAKAVGPQQAQGLRFLTGYYWDRDDASRAFAKRFAARMGGMMPSQAHAGIYSATAHYLKAIAAAKTDDGKLVMQTMKKLPVEDFFAGKTRLREDGRLMKDMFLVEVKSPAEVKQPWDLLKVLKTVPAADIIRPVSEGGCDISK
jgi:branched-chain amino acid transport system substrate-binding protein